jgi:hypothetical protein
MIMNVDDNDGDDAVGADLLHILGKQGGRRGVRDTSLRSINKLISVMTYCVFFAVWTGCHDMRLSVLLMEVTCILIINCCISVDMCPLVCKSTSSTHQMWFKDCL